MSCKPLVQSEDDFVGIADDVEKSLLHNEMNGRPKEVDMSRWTQLKGCAIYLVMTFCFGALLVLAIVPLGQSRAECGSCPSQDDQRSIIFHTHRTRHVHAEILRPVENTELREAVSGSYINVRFDGTFDRSSPYKGPPSPEVDALWHQLTGCKLFFALLEDQFIDVPNVGVMSIPEQVYEHLNASKYAVKVPNNLGGGRMAIFEMIHQLHCVVSVPKASSHSSNLI